MRSVSILLFDGAEELDFAGPWEVFAYLAATEPGLCSARTVSETGGTIRCARGLRVMADHTYADAPPADILIVPGGEGRKWQMRHGPTLEFVKQVGAGAEVVASVCTGAFILAHAGLLRGRSATTYWACCDELEATAPETGLSRVARDARFVDEGPVMTAAGVSAGIDLSLHIIGKLWSVELARQVQKGIEYYPAPPYAPPDAR
jgi:transcriptional regulator GlxA family with amidase domain